MTNGRSAAASSSRRRASASGAVRRAPARRAPAPAPRSASSACPPAAPAPPGRAGPASRCGRRGHVLGQAVGVVDLADPLGEAERSGAEHLPVVDLLERLAVALVARDLADEQDQRRRVLERGVQADRGVARARPAGDEAQPGRPLSLPCASAMKPAPPSWRQATKRIRSRCSWKPSSAARKLSPGTPNAVSTPCAISASIRAWPAGRSGERGSVMARREANREDTGLALAATRHAQGSPRCLQFTVW